MRRVAIHCRLWLGFAATMLLSAFAISAVVHAAEPASVVITFDGSGSMWGKLPGSNNHKFGVAREGLKQAFEKIPPETRVGLASFGHRRQGDCSDVEVMLKPEKIDPARILSPLEKLNPKGRGPLVQALREAAKTLGTGPLPTSIVLIHDDLDNCQQDPCAAASEIAKAQPGLAIHVISLGLKKEDAVRMECVAKATGGRHFDSQDAGQATTALLDAMRLASSAPAPSVPAQAPAPSASPAVPAPVAAARPVPAQPAARPTVATPTAPGLYLSARLTANSEPVEAPIRWRVLGDASTIAVAEATGPSPAIELPAGTYVVEARAGGVSSRHNVEIAAGKVVQASLVLNAGALRVSAPLQIGGQSHPSAVLTVREISQKGATGAGKVVALGPIESAPLVLPAGNYRLTVEDGATSRSRTISIVEGEIAEIEMPLSAGRLSLRTTGGVAGKEADRVLFVITEEDPEVSGGRREVARSAATSPVFTLPAGNYQVIARRTGGEVRERVLVTAGENIERTLVLGVGTVLLQARADGSAAREQIQFRAFAVDDAAREAGQATGPSARIELPTGRYRIESRLGRQNAIVVRDVEVRAGAEQRVQFEHLAASVRLRLSEGGQAGADAMWEVRDAEDQVVWRSMQAEPRGLLAAGRYKARVRTRDRQLERAFEVRADGRQVDVTVE